MKIRLSRSNVPFSRPTRQMEFDAFTVDSAPNVTGFPLLHHPIPLHPAKCELSAANPLHPEHVILPSLPFCFSCILTHVPCAPSQRLSHASPFLIHPPSPLMGQAPLLLQSSSHCIPFRQAWDRQPFIKE